MTTQRFKSVVATSGTRVFIPLPFNPNEVWGVKQRHHITGTVNGYGVRGSLGSDGTQYFLLLGAAWPSIKIVDGEFARLEKTGKLPCNSSLCA